MGDRAPGAKAVERAVRPSGKTRDEERNDIIGLVLGSLLTVAGAGLTSLFGCKVHKNRTGKK